jgi:CheY-like chemotaxis protein
VPRKILVVEDDLDDQFLIAEAFQSIAIGCELIFALHGRHALDLIQQDDNWPDLVLLDLNMPIMNGFEVLARLQEGRILPRVPVVILTTTAEPAAIDRSYDLGANSYLVKPKTFSQLQALARQLTDYWFDAVRLSTPIR